MKLTYRGISYEANPPEIESTPGEIGGKYRGVDWKTYPRHIPVPQPILDLKYRGTSYCIGHPVDIEANQLRKKYAISTPTTASTAKNEAKPTVNNRKQFLEELNNTHRSNIRSSLEHRLQAAKAKGDQNLIRLLQAEAKQL